MFGVWWGGKTPLVFCRAPSSRLCADFGPFGVGVQRLRGGSTCLRRGRVVKIGHCRERQRGREGGVVVGRSQESAQQGRLGLKSVMRWCRGVGGGVVVVVVVARLVRWFRRALCVWV